MGIRQKPLAERNVIQHASPRVTTSSVVTRAQTVRERDFFVISLEIELGPAMCELRVIGLSGGGVLALWLSRSGEYIRPASVASC